MSYVPPEFLAQSFTCPHCGVYAQFWWQEAKEEVALKPAGSIHRAIGVHIANCHHCRGRMFWFMENNVPHVLFPFNVSAAPLPHSEMPDDVKRDYLEARSIADASPRGAAALLRLSVQRLCKHLGETGKEINADIASLVQKGLPLRIQQALDVVRVTGNNAVHPGELALDDSPAIVQSLFQVVNFVVENRIAEPKRIEALYAALPEGSRKAIERRDG